MKGLGEIFSAHLRTIAFVLALNVMLGAALWALSPDSHYSTQQTVQLKARAVRVFEAEHQERTVEYGFLVALSNAIKFQQFERVEQLLNQYESGHKI